MPQSLNETKSLAFLMTEGFYFLFVDEKRNEVLLNEVYIIPAILESNY